MNEHQTICVSPIHSDRKMLAEDSPRGSPGGSDNCTGLTGTTFLNQEPDRLSNTTITILQSPHQSGRGPTPLGSEELTLPGCMETSGVQSRIREFQERLSKSYALHEEVQRKPILQPGEVESLV